MDMELYALLFFSGLLIGRPNRFELTFKLASVLAPAKNVFRTTASGRML